MLQRDIIFGNRLPVLQQRIWKFMPGMGMRYPADIYNASHFSLLHTKYEILEFITFSKMSLHHGLLLRKFGEVRIESVCVETPDYEAFHGHLEKIQFMREYGAHCTEGGADWAAIHGYLDVVQDLRKHGIHCTSFGANYASDPEIIKDLEDHGIYSFKRNPANKFKFFGMTLSIINYLSIALSIASYYFFAEEKA